METGLAVSLVIGLLILMIAGAPVAVALGGMGLVGLWIAAGPHVALSSVALEVGSSMRSFTLIALPMFILMAEILIFSGVTEKMFKGMGNLIGHWPGGLLLASRGATTLFAAVTGSSAASTATIGAVSIPQMINYKYHPRVTVGSVGAGGGLAIVMPPSVLLIIYGFIAEVSVASLFLAGILPALLMSSGYVMWNLWLGLRRPELAPRLPRQSRAVRRRAWMDVGPVLLVAGALLGSIYLGLATVTEAAAVGVLASLVLAVMNGTVTRERVNLALLNTAKTTGFIFFIVIGALIFAGLMSRLKVPAVLTSFFLGLDAPEWAIVLGVVLVFMMLGTFMDALAIMLVAVPVMVAPMNAIGLDLVWLGIVLTVAIEMGFTTPPFGLNLFILQGTAKSAGIRISYSDAVAGCSPYLIADACALALILAFPPIALWLPTLLRG